MVEGFRGVENSELFAEEKVRWKKRRETLFGNNFVKQSLGGWSDGGTPGPIPNPVVKAVSADGTWGAAPWESRSPPRDFSI